MPEEPFFFDPDHLARVAEGRREGYRAAKPFPHAVIDGLFPDHVLEAVLAEFPAPTEAEWWTFDGEDERKLASRDDSIMGPCTRHLLAQLNSSSFLRFVEDLTGISGLIPDPHFYGGGLHQIEPGGFLKIHADFDGHPTLNLERRLNLLVYLNKEWDDAYGGHLELWNQDMSACEERVLPVFNRTVLFDTSDQSYHGHPDPLACPDGMSRKSLALYYYTAPTRASAGSHNTLFQRRPSDGPGEAARREADLGGLRSRVIEVLPEPVAARLRRVRDTVLNRTHADRPATTAEPDPTDVNSMFAWGRAAGRSRPEYLWPVIHAARSAANLGIERISVLEFGVAGGNGLLALEAAAEFAEGFLPVKVDVVGFDTGTGMPEPVDHRDIPWTLEAGYFAMDVPALQARLRRAELVLGPVSDTVAAWLQGDHAPIGFVSFDLDYYSSTVDALTVLDGDDDTLLPRVVCYFDDVLGFGWSDFNGARAAIGEFNDRHEQRKVGLVHGLRYLLPRSELELAWPEKIFVMHAFDHEGYNRSEGRPAAYWFDSLRLAEDAEPPGRADG